MPSYRKTEARDWANAPPARRLRAASDSLADLATAWRAARRAGRPGGLSPD